MDQETGASHQLGRRVIAKPGGRFGELVYEDTGEPISRHPTHPCVKCGLRPGPNGDDPCIVRLPGVSFACCGHGVAPGYIAFKDGRTIRFPTMTVEGERQWLLSLRSSAPDGTELATTLSQDGAEDMIVTAAGLKCFETRSLTRAERTLLDAQRRNEDRGTVATSNDVGGSPGLRRE